MSKSVLVMETPEDCRSCYLRKLIRNWSYCAVKSERIKDSMVKPDWCPLKPLPKYKSMEKPWEYEYGKMHGWNACLREIAETSEENKQRK